MAEKFTIRPAGQLIVVRTGDSVLAETRNALVLSEDGYAPVYYFPREDVAMELLDRSDKVTHCPHKGDATHYHIGGYSGRISDGAWSYETPKEAASDIAGYLAFYTDKLAVEVL
jgi:uncharacterized protein (DUF427 family)